MILYHITLYRMIVVYYVILCYVMLCYVMLCYVRLSYIILYVSSPHARAHPRDFWPEGNPAGRRTRAATWPEATISIIGAHVDLATYFELRISCYTYMIHVFIRVYVCVYIYIYIYIYTCHYIILYYIIL